MTTSFYAYAKAIYELTENKDDQNKWLEYLQALNQISKEKAVNKLFLEPAFGIEKMHLFITALLEKKEKISILESNFLQIILKNKRFFDLKKIIEAYQAIIYEKNDTTIAKIKSSIDIDFSDLNYIKKLLKDRLNKEIQTEVEISPDSIGVQIYVGHYHFDYTIETVVEKMKQKILKG